MPTVRYGSPRDKQYRRAIDAWQENRLATNLLLEPGQDRVYGGNGQVPGYDWPNPSALGRATALTAQRQRAAATITENLRPDVFYVGSDRELRDPGQVLGYDWQTDLPPRTEPNRRARVDVARRSDVDVEEIPALYVGQDRVYGGPGQVPSYSWQLDLPPKGKPYPVALRTFADSEVQWNLLGKDTIYGAPGQAPTYDQPLPPRGYARSIELRTFLLQNPRYTLVGQDTIYGAAGQAPVYDTPLPVRLQVRLRPDDWHDLDQTLIGQDVLYGAPGLVVAWDWPVPRGYVRASTLRTHLDDVLLNTLTTVAPTFYGAPGQAVTYDWQLALPVRLKASAIDLRSLVSQGEPLLLPGQDRVYGGNGQTPAWDWPTPRPAARRGQPTQDAVDAVLSLLSAVIDPVRTYDQPLPVRVLARLRQAEQGVVAVTLVAVDPVRPTDMPLLARARLRQADQHSADVILIGADRIYGAPGQVPSYDLRMNPRGYASRIRQDLQAWAMIDNYPIAVIVARVLARLFGLDEPVKRTSGLDQATLRTFGEEHATIRRKGIDE